MAAVRRGVRAKERIMALLDMVQRNVLMVMMQMSVGGLLSFVGHDRLAPPVRNSRQGKYSDVIEALIVLSR